MVQSCSCQSRRMEPFCNDQKRAKKYRYKVCIMISKRSFEGQLTIDHSASPGLPADFYKKIGLDAPAVGEGIKYQAPTITCCHCGSVFVINPNRQRARNHCQKCDQYVCDSPACNAGCTPHAKTLDQEEERLVRALSLKTQSSFTLR